VVLTGDHLETLTTVSVTDDAVAIGACTLHRSASDGAVRVARDGSGGVVASTERGAMSCAAPVAAARVGIGIVAHAGASLRSLTLARGAGP